MKGWDNGKLVVKRWQDNPESEVSHTDMPHGDGDLEAVVSVDIDGGHSSAVVPGRQVKDDFVALGVHGSVDIVDHWCSVAQV